MNNIETKINKLIEYCRTQLQSKGVDSTASDLRSLLDEIGNIDTHMNVIKGMNSYNVDTPEYHFELTPDMFDENSTEIYSKYYYNKNITKVEIPNNIKTIKGSAFSHCDNLTSITIPDSVTSIESNVFANCISLTSVTIPDGVTSIGSYAFDCCYGLTDLIIGNGVRSMDQNAFKSCKNLTRVTIKNGVPIIGESAFYDCTKLPSITIPDSVTSIGKRAFRDCRSLSSITIPDSVTSIGDYILWDCANLTSVTMPNSFTTIPYGTFSGCGSLTKIKIPDSVTSIGESVFYSCRSLQIIDFRGVKQVPTLKSSTFTFSGVPKSCKIIIPDDLYDSWITATNWSSIYASGYQFIKVSEYYGTDGLAYTLNEDGESYTCSGIGTATDTVISIGQVYNDKPVTSIGNKAFLNRSNLTNVNIPNNIISIGNDAFKGCRSLSGINIPNSVTSIGDGTFYGCTSLTSIIIPNGVTSIGENAFNGCSSLTNINIPNNVTSIGTQAFHGCSSITNIIIPASVENIGSNPFKYCSALESITVEEGNSTYYSDGNCLISTTGVLISGCKNSVIPNNGSVLAITSDAFTGQSGLIDITLPDDMRNGSIGFTTFYDCTGLTNIVMGNSIKSIDIYAFGNCTSLNIIDFRTSKNVPVLSNISAFDGMPSTCKIIVPDALYDEWISATNWTTKSSQIIKLSEYNNMEV